MTNPKNFAPRTCACGCGEFTRTKGALYCHGHHLRLIRDARPAKPIADRFWLKVVKGSGCWAWTGKRSSGGYGMLRAGKKDEGYLVAHRVSYAINVGTIPEGMHVLHACDNPSCVRPDHLFVGTALTNARDRTAKGRTPSGDSHYIARRRRPT